MFKPNVKAQVENKAKVFYGRNAKIIVSGRRPSSDECKKLFIPEGNYFVELFINEKHIASCTARDWRIAYKRLKLALEKNYENFGLNGELVTNTKV
jgi:meiotically up-regulated gene 157 (Mug157) protein